MSELDELLDDVFHGCAFAAFVEEASKVGGVPCQERTRRRAYGYFEEALAEKQERTSSSIENDTRHIHRETMDA